MSRLLPPCVMKDLAATVDEQVMRSFARSNNISEEEREQRFEQLALDDRRCARGKLAAMCTKRGSPHRSGGAANERLESSSAPMPAGSEKKHATNSKRKRESMQ